MGFVVCLLFLMFCYFLGVECCFDALVLDACFGFSASFGFLDLIFDGFCILWQLVLSFALCLGN